MTSEPRRTPALALPCETGPGLAATQRGPSRDEPPWQRGARIVRGAVRGTNSRPLKARQTLKTANPAAERARDGPGYREGLPPKDVVVAWHAYDLAPDQGVRTSSSQPSPSPIDDRRRY